MATPIEMPKLSDTMEEGVLSAWLADEGDAVSAGDVIAQVETDKATMDLEVYDDGVLLKRVADEGANVPLGALIAVLGEEGEDISDVLAEYDAGGDGAAAEADEADTDEDEEADAEAADENQDTAEEEATEEDESDEDEDVGTRRAASGEEAPPEDEAAQEDTDAQESKKQESGAPSASENGRVKASPLARRMAQENDLDLAAIDGSGPRGRVVKRDVEAALEEGTAAPAKEKEAAPSGDGQPGEEPAYQMPSQVAPDGQELYEAQPISQMRKTIARRLAESKYTAPHFYLTVDIDMAAAADFRAELNELSERRDGPRISFNDLITKACAVALKSHPQVNASYLEDEGEIRFHKPVHVAVAVAVEEGLLTPVIRNADQKGLGQISKETRALAEKARDKKLQPEDYEGSTFTTSNLGMFGIEEFTAIINPPNACILAIGAVRDEPVVEGREVVPGKRMRVTLSCDHRVVDGATGAQFLADVKDFLEEPKSLLL